MKRAFLGVSAFLLTFAVPAREWRDFNDEIARISAAGGGRVTVPAGAWETGPIHLRSNVELHFEEGADVLFTDDLSARPADFDAFWAAAWGSSSPGSTGTSRRRRSTFRRSRT